MRFDKTHTQTHRRQASAERSSGMRKRLIFMTVLLGLVAIALFSAHSQRKRLAKHGQDRLPTAEEHVTERVVLPDFDVAAFDALVSDAAPADRVLSEPEALARLTAYARLLADAHFEALGIEDLDAATRAAIVADTSAARARAYRVRGYVETIATRERTPGLEEHYGVLRLENGDVVHFVVLDVPERTTLDSYVRIDGLFLKLFSIEGADGWLEGPLIVAPRAVRSYPALAGGGSLADYPGGLLALVEDDSVRSIVPPPFEAKWALAAFARDLQPDAVDWDAAPKLDNRLMSELLENGASLRGKPIRISPARNQGTWVEQAGENPARIERITTGWIGSWEWTNKAGVIHFILPYAAPELQRSVTITGRGFFLRNHAYEARDGGLRVAPMFVMHSIDIFTPPEAADLNWLLYGIGALTLALMLLFWLLLTRDRRRSHALHEELVRRRRARRERSSAAPTGPE